MTSSSYETLLRGSRHRGNGKAGELRAIIEGAGVVLTVVVFAAVLHYSYSRNISPVYEYAGLTYRTPNALNYTIAIVATSVVALTLPRRIRHTSDFILWLFFVVAGAPSILVTQYALILSSGEATVLGLHVAACLIMIRTVTLVRPRRFMPHIVIEPALFWLLLWCASAAIYAYLTIVNGLHFRLLSIDSVYAVRSEFADVTSDDALLGYLLPLQYGVINPLFLARGFYGRRLGYFVAGALGQALVYMTVGYKSVLFSIVAVVVIGCLFRYRPRMRGALLMRVIVSGALLALVVDTMISAVDLTGLFIRRFLVIPGALTSAYVLIFADRPKTNFADSLLPFLSSPYTTAPTHIVGDLFVGNAGTAANVNLFGHGFLSYGYIGMYIEGLFLAVLLWMVDDVTRRIPTAVASIVFLMPTIALTNASVFTAMLTHGFLGALLICALAPATGWARARSTGVPYPGVPIDGTVRHPPTRGV